MLRGVQSDPHMPYVDLYFMLRTGVLELNGKGPLRQGNKTARNGFAAHGGPLIAVAFPCLLDFAQLRPGIRMLRGLHRHGNRLTGLVIVLYGICLFSIQHIGIFADREAADAEVGKGIIPPLKRLAER